MGLGVLGIEVDEDSEVDAEMSAGAGSGTEAGDCGSPGAPVVVVMGVAGTGKTTVGRLLAEALGLPYAEADAFHPRANVAKMAAGTPLDDGDRMPWLDAIGAWAHGREGHGGVVSCSALKRSYRDRLRAAAPHLFFLHLTGDRALIGARMRERVDHFMPPSLLDSQFATLEPLQPDERGAAVSVAVDPAEVTRRAVAALRNAGFPTASASPSPTPSPSPSLTAPTAPAGERADAADAVSGAVRA